MTQMAKFEKSVTLQLLNEQVREMNTGPALLDGTYLRNPVAYEGALVREVGARHLQAAKSARVDNETYGVGDMVVVRPDNEVVEIELCLVLDNARFCALCTRWALHGDGELYNKGSNYVLVPFDMMRGSCIWRPVGARRRVLFPPTMCYV